MPSCVLITSVHFAGLLLPPSILFPPPFSSSRLDRLLRLWVVVLARPGAGLDGMRRRPAVKQGEGNKGMEIADNNEGRQTG